MFPKSLQKSDQYKSYQYIGNLQEKYETGAGTRNSKGSNQSRQSKPAKAMGSQGENHRNPGREP